MLVVPAYAKVNLALEVTGRRPDGWHDIATVIATIDWHDLVGIELHDTDTTEATPRVRLCVTGPFAEGVPTGAANLAVVAAHFLLRLAGDPLIGIDLRLRKEVPSAAGLGGGSADAAAVLRAGKALLASRGFAIDPSHLSAAAAELGSDVPAVLAGGTLLATGRGELLTALPTPSLHLAVAVAGPSATAAAYQALTGAESVATTRAARLADALLRRVAPLDDALLGSALEPPATRAAPGLRESLDHLRALTPDNPWHLTGSGGAAFTLASTAQAAKRLAATAEAAGFPARACRTVAPRLASLPPRSPST
jgi:4-diphosphocytidyl-2-C-methyl-D-erythritol kinase